MVSIRSAGCALLLLLASALAAGCANFNQPLSAENRSRIREAHVSVVVPQETFLFTAMSTQFTAALGGGLLPALIDASVQKSRQEGMRARIQPVLDRLIDVDFREEARTVLRQPMGAFAFPVAQAEVVSVMPSKSQHDVQLAALKPGQALVRLTMQYAIDPNSLMLTARTYANVWQPGLADKAYGGSLIYQGRCTSLDPAAVRAQIRDAMAQTLRAAALDISQPASQGQRPVVQHVYLAAQPIKIDGEQLAGDAARVLVRAKDGTVFSLAR